MDLSTQWAASRARTQRRHARRTSEGAPKGVAHHSTKLTPELVHEIRYGRFVGVYQRAIAHELGISQATVSEIRTRKIWRHVP
jgi:DNA-binding transcriptional regulator YiaG